MKNQKKNFFVIIFLMSIITFYHILVSLNASLMDYFLLTIGLFFLIGSIGNIFKEYHNKENKKKNNSKEQTIFKIGLN